MTNIRPNISSPSGFAQPSRKRSDSEAPTHDRDTHRPPVARGFRTIPAQDALDGMIKRAVSALREGIYWDRGSILNLEV